MTNIAFSRLGRPIAASALAGAVGVIAEAHQMPPRPVPPPWQNLPVTPARLRWRVRRDAQTVRAWHTPVDFSKGLLPPEKFRVIYAPGTRQNQAGKPGLYRLYLAHTWSTDLLPDGTYQLEVEASDRYGNNGTKHVTITVVNNL